MSSGKWRASRLGLNVLTLWRYNTQRKQLFFFYFYLQITVIYILSGAPRWGRTHGSEGRPLWIMTIEWTGYQKECFVITSIFSPYTVLQLLVAKLFTLNVHHLALVSSNC